MLGACVSLATQDKNWTMKELSFMQIIVSEYGRYQWNKVDKLKK